jgi:hypothetical protein
MFGTARPDLLAEIYMPDDSNEKEARIAAAADRALAEAAARRAAARPLDLPRELGGRDGPEPIRFGDWERKGIASDF